ncbi:hypothetical protein ABTA44_19745, partial [Acinetobacter baumannii]
MPGAGGDQPDNRGQFQTKGLGELIAESKAYAEWSRNGGLDLSWNDVLFSDLMVKAQFGDTLAAKAVMSTGSGYAPQAIRLPGIVEAV